MEANIDRVRRRALERFNWDAEQARVFLTNSGDGDVSLAELAALRTQFLSNVFADELNKYRKQPLERRYAAALLAHAACRKYLNEETLAELVRRQRRHEEARARNPLMDFMKKKVPPGM